MRTLQSLLAPALATTLLLTATHTSLSAADLAPQLETVRAVGSGAQGSEAAAQAWAKLSKSDAAEIPAILAALDGANPLAANYLRSAVDTIAERTLAAGGKLPAAELEKYLGQTKHDPRGRRLAYELIVRGDPDAADRLLPGMVGDPSVEIRRDAIARLIKQAEASKSVADYQQAFRWAVDDDQVKQLAAKLKEAGETVDLARHYGFLMDWQVVGPLDNKDEKGYARVYPPEKEIDLAASYTGTEKGEPVTWKPVSTTDDYGVVNLNKEIVKANGVLVYCTTDFHSDKPREVQFRLTSKNATKLWVNGKLIDQHEVYHAGGALDQYISSASLKAGKNVILLKVCQNEQTQSWAQDWQFQLRVCDASGTAILSTKRGELPNKAAGE